MEGSIIQKLLRNKGKIAILMFLGGTLSHAMDTPILEVSVGGQILESTNCFGEGFLYPFVEDEQEYERLKHNSVYYPFAWDTTYETLNKNPFLFEIAKNSGFLEVSRRTPLKNSSSDDDLLWSEQQEFFKDMNLEKLANFWPEMKIGTDKEGNIFSHSHYKSYVFHSREFKANKQHIPCLIESNQVNDSFVLGKLHEQQILYDYQYRILKRYHYQFSFYHLYDSSKENQYILWIEAYNPRKSSNCVLDQITIRKIQNIYYSSILDIIENMDVESKSLNVTGERREASENQPEMVLEMPVESPLEVHETSQEVRKFSEDISVSNKTNDMESSADLIMKIIDDNGDTPPKKASRDKLMPKQGPRRKSLSNYIARSIHKVDSLDLQKMQKPDTHNSLSTPNSPTITPHEYTTGLTPKSAPVSNRVRISDSEIIRVNKSDDQKDYQEILEDLKLVEKQRELVEKQREKLIQKLKAFETPVGTSISTSRSSSLHSSSPTVLSPVGLSSMGTSISTSRSSSLHSSSASVLSHSGSASREPSPHREIQRDDLHNSKSFSNSSKSLLKSKRTKSADQYNRRTDSSWKIRSSRDKSVSPRVGEKKQIL